MPPPSTPAVKPEKQGTCSPATQHGYQHAPGHSGLVDTELHCDRVGGLEWAIAQRMSVKAAAEAVLRHGSGLPRVLPVAVSKA
jgi:hypothetical protein